MTICPVCALTGRVTEVQHPDTPHDWRCPNCNTAGHHPTLGS